MLPESLPWVVLRENDGCDRLVDGLRRAVARVAQIRVDAAFVGCERAVAGHLLGRVIVSSWLPDRRSDSGSGRRSRSRRPGRCRRRRPGRRRACHRRWPVAAVAGCRPAGPGRRPAPCSPPGPRSRSGCAGCSRTMLIARCCPSDSGCGPAPARGRCGCFRAGSRRAGVRRPPRRRCSAGSTRRAPSVRSERCRPAPLRAWSGRTGCWSDIARSAIGAAVAALLHRVGRVGQLAGHALRDAAGPIGRVAQDLRHALLVLAAQLAAACGEVLARPARSRACRRY